MARFASISLTIFIALCLLAAFQRPAYGYVDPGSGFVALQTLASVAAAGGYFLRRRIRGLFGGKAKDEETPVDEVKMPVRAGAQAAPARMESAGHREMKDTRRPA